MKNIKSFFCFILLLAWFGETQAADLTLSNWQWHGFLSQGIIDVNGSDFVSNDDSISSELTEVGINTSVQLLSNVRFATQAVYLDGGDRYSKGARIDYLLLDWGLFNKNNWQANLYIGRFKNVHWLYSSVRDVPFARPSIILPQSVYFDGFRDIAVSGDGAALKLSYTDDSYGDFDVNYSYGTSPLSKKQGQIILSKLALGDVKQDIDSQASFYWRPVFSSWRFGLSLLDSDFSYHSSAQDYFADGKFSFQFYTLNALYEGEKWEFSGEIYQERFVTKGFYHSQFLQDHLGQGAYIQTRYKLNDDFTLLARYEKFYMDKEDKKGKQLEIDSAGAVPHYFAFQNDFTFSLSYDLTNNFKFRLEHHWVNGGARLTPIVLPNPLINNQQHWQITALQLMMWF